MNETINYANVASASSARLGKMVAELVYELEQWRNLAETFAAERDQLRQELAAASEHSDEQKQD